jgi:hypothetical protein
MLSGIPDTGDIEASLKSDIIGRLTHDVTCHVPVGRRCCSWRRDAR